MKKLFSLLLLMMAVGTVMASTPVEKKDKFTTEWSSLKKHNAVPEWLEDAKLGIYFHWGVYSVPGYDSEWYGRFMYMPDRKGWGSKIYKYHRDTYGENFDYHDFVPMWKAPNFDAKRWVDMFENMGAKIIGTIAEHHDGFSLWDSQVNEWNSAGMGPHIDVVKAIGAEAKKRDLRFMTTFHHGFHSMFFPKQEATCDRPVSRHLACYEDNEVPTDAKYRKLYGTMSLEEENQIWLGKLDEIINEYCPDFIWMDFGQVYIKEQYRQKFLQHYFNKAHEMDQEVVVNTKGDFFPKDLSIVNVERATMEDITPNLWVTDFILGGGWAFNQLKRIAIDPKLAIRILAEVVSKNGMMLLSAGPMADGTIPVEQVEAMEKIGAWTKLYGEAIYGTRPFVSFGQGPTVLKRDPKDEWNQYGGIKNGFHKLNAKDVRYTKKGRYVYAIQLGWGEAKAKQTLKALAKGNGFKVRKVEVMGCKERIRWKQTADGLVVTQPKEKPAEGDAAIVYKIKL